MIKQKIKIIKNKLKETKGVSTTILGISKILLIISIFYAMFTVMNILTLITNSRALIEEATIETIQRNYTKLYHTSREGYSGGYRPNETGFYESYIDDKNSIIKTLTKNDNMILKENKLIKVDKNNQQLYGITGIETAINNESIMSGTQRFIMETNYIFEYPIIFFGKEYDINVPMKIKVKHTGKF